MQPLFRPLTVREVAFPNRIVMPPMVSGLGDDDGFVTDAVAAHYAARAEAGTGYLIVEATAVSPGGRCWPKGLCLYDDRYIPGLRRVADAIHARGAVAGIQLVHGGPQASPDLSGGETVGPSAIAPSEGAHVPRALRAEELPVIVDDFAAAAARAEAAGFDAVQVHGAHGYLLDSFLSAVRNRREDGYGGSLERRMRLLLEACRAMRATLAPRILFECRISLYNKQPDEFDAGGFEQLVQAIAATGIDLLHLSTDGANKLFFGTGRTLGWWAKDVIPLPVIVAGGLGDPRDANRLLAQGDADCAAIGKAMFDDPEWARKAREILGE